MHPALSSRPCSLQITPVVRRRAQHRTSRRVLVRRILAGSILAMLASHGAQGASYYWDADGTALGDNPVSGGNLGGTGAWDTSSALWYNAATGGDVTWPNSLLDTAILLGG